jgi:Tfp pilus assembly protein PilO
MQLTMPKMTVPVRRQNTVARSQAERLWLIGGGLVGLLVALIAYFLFISPQRSKTADINSQVSQARDQNATLQARVDALAEQNKNLPSYERQLAAAQLALPSEAGVSDFLRSLQTLGNATLTNVTQLTVGQPVDVTSVVNAAPVQPGAPANASPSATSAAAGSVGPAVTGPPIYALPITAQVSGTPAALNKFLDQLQAVQPRAVLITQIGETTGVTGGAGARAASSVGTTLQLTMDAFVAPSGSSLQVSPSAGSH